MHEMHAAATVAHGCHHERRLQHGCYSSCAGVGVGALRTSEQTQRGFQMASLVQGDSTRLCDLAPALVLRGGRGAESSRETRLRLFTLLTNHCTVSGLTFRDVHASNHGHSRLPPHPWPISFGLCLSSQLGDAACTEAMHASCRPRPINGSCACSQQATQEAHKDKRHFERLFGETRLATPIWYQW